MPWIKTADGEKFESPPAPETNAPLPAGVSERDPAAHAQRRRENEELGYWWQRMMVDFVRFHEHCPRKACRRAGACRSPTVQCHDENRAALRAEVYPVFREAVKARARELGIPLPGEGPAAPTPRRRTSRGPGARP